MRLLQTTHDNSRFGTVQYVPTNNDVSIIQDTHSYADLGVAINSNEIMPKTDMTGEGILSGISDFIKGDPETYRPGFKGENHAILKLKNGFGRANYMGPGTHLDERLRRGDPPRTLSDKVSQRHDIDYGLAKSQADVSKADRRMIASLKRLKREKKGNNLNIEMGLRPIQAKLAMESRGLIKSGRIASFGDIKPENMKMAMDKRDELEQQGFGLPVEMLRSKLINKMKRARSKKGKGLSLPGGGVVKDLKKMVRGVDKKKLAKKIAVFVIEKLAPVLIKKLQSGTGLKLAGAGIIRNKKLKSMVYMKMLKRLNDGASRNGKAILGNGIMPSAEKLKGMAKDAAKMLLPILIKAGTDKLNKKLSGKGMRTMTQRDIDNFKPSLSSKLTTGMLKALVGFFKKQSGMGYSVGQGCCGMTTQEGEGFFGDFAKGFKKGFMGVINPAIKVAKTLAPLAPLLL